MARNSIARVMHDVGLAAWFGGSLMGAVGLNGASQDVKDVSDRARVASMGWARWSPVNAAAIGLHLIGGARLVRVNRGRLSAQQRVAGLSAAKTALTAAALGATAYSGVLGREVQLAGSVPAQAGTVPADATPSDAAEAQSRLRALQWAIPALTGGIVCLSAVMGEQQRAGEVLKGAARRAAQAASLAGRTSKHGAKLAGSHPKATAALIGGPSGKAAKTAVRHPKATAKSAKGSAKVAGKAARSLVG